VTHLIPTSAPRVGRTTSNEPLYTAACGSVVPLSAQARSGQPSCPDCARADDEDAAAYASVLAMHQTPPENPVTSSYGDTLAGYTPRRKA
jgi:hypothetical protein